MKPLLIQLDGSFIGLLDTSLPQNGVIRAGPNVVPKLPRHKRDATLRVSKDPMVARGPDVAPPCVFQCSDQIANLLHQLGVFFFAADFVQQGFGLDAVAAETVGEGLLQGFEGAPGIA